MFRFKTCLLFILLISLGSSCGEDCDTTNVGNTIIGAWEITNGIGIPIEEDFVSFQSDLNGIGVTNGSFYAVGLNDQSIEFKYEINVDTLELIYSNQIVRKYNIEFTDCDNLLVQNEIKTLSLRRK